MATNHAAWLPAEKVYPFEIKEAPMYTPDENQILVRVRAVGINSIDYKLQTLALYPIKYPTILGQDIAGEVVTVGANITRVKAGDRVMGGSAGFVKQKIDHMAYQEYCLLEHNMFSPIPAGFSFEQAAVLPVCTATAAAFLFEENFLHLDMPTLPARSPNGKTILVSGGASALGGNCIQQATMAGYEVITTASPKNHATLKRLGASQVFDYNQPTLVADLVAACKDKNVVGVLDCIGKQACQPMLDFAKQSGKVSFVGTCTSGAPEPPEGIRVGHVMGLSIMKNHIAKAIFEDFLPKALESGKYVAYPEPNVVGTGLEAIQGALDRVAKGVSAQKFIVQL